MNTPTHNDITQCVNDENTKPIRIISAALAGGVTLFAIVCFVFYFQGLNNVEGFTNEGGIQSILVIALILLAVPVYSVVFLFPGFLIKQSLKEKGITIGSSDPIGAEDLLAITVTHQIVKMAMLEGATLFGLVVFMISIMNRSIYENQTYWLVLIPWLIMLGYIITNFPTKEKMIELISYKVVPEIKNN